MKKYALLPFLFLPCGIYIAAGEVGQLLFELARGGEDLEKPVRDLCSMARDERFKRVAVQHGHNAVIKALRVFAGLSELKQIMPQLCKELAQSEEYRPLFDALKAVQWQARYKNPFDGSKETPNSTQLILATESGDLSTVNFLISFGADVNVLAGKGLKHSPLYRASFRGYEAIVMSLLQAGAKCNIPGESASPLLGASQEGHGGVVRLLLARHPNVNAVSESTTRTALHQASQNGHASVVEQLLAVEGVKVDILDGHGMSPLLLASFNGHAEVLRLLLQAGAQIDTLDSRGVWPLVAASECGHLPVVELLLEAGADVNRKAKSAHNNRTVLHQASKNGHEAVVARLLKAKGIHIDALDDKKVSPLAVASGGGHAGVVRLLLADGAQKDMPDDRGVGPLMRASDGGHLPVVELLLEAGADVNSQAKGVRNRTALHQASQNGHKTVARMLLAAGANRSLTDTRGMTALRLAQYNNEQAVVELLKGAEATE